MNHLTIFFVTDELFYCVRTLNTVYIYTRQFIRRRYMYISIYIKEEDFINSCSEV